MLDLVLAVAGKYDCAPTEAIDRIERTIDAPSIITRLQRSAIGDFVQRLRRLRMRRNDLIGAPLFRDPAWDMLLELYSAHQQGRELSVSSLCYASGVPQTTALRQLARLEEHGLITRSGDSNDNRRYIVSPTGKALDGIAAAARLLLEESHLATARLQT